MATRKYKKGADGYYRTKAWDGTYNADGTKHRINLKSDKSSKDLERQVQELAEKIKNRQVVNQTDILFIDFCREWNMTFKAVRETKTKEMYNRIIEGYLSMLSNIRLCDINRMHFQQVINAAFDHPRTCQQIALVFRQVIRYAVESRNLPAGAFEEICRGISLPKYQKSLKRGLTETERKAVKTADFTDRERCFVYLIYYLGLRREEALGLRPIDIDMKSRIAHIRQALIFNNNDPEIKGPKSQNGIRDIPIPDELHTFLCGYLPACTNYLVTTAAGKPMTKSAYRKMWDSILRKMNLAAGGTDHVRVITGLTAHIFRHNYCTQLCYQVPEISLNTIARLLGDSRQMVVNVYSHIQEERENVVQAVENAVNF